jgi:hypothetical protein
VLPWEPLIDLLPDEGQFLGPVAEAFSDRALRNAALH